MARSDLLISLAKAGTAGNQDQFRKILEAIIAEERAKKHDILANQLNALLFQDRPVNRPEARNGALGAIHDLCFELLPQRSLSELFLPESILTTCQELVEEQLRRDVLQSHGLTPRHRVMLVGPPGNGKTTLAEAIAQSLMVPLIVARYDGLIGSYLGETTVRLRKLFEYARTRGCVLFFDEFDTLGKERGDVHETGEIKRVVSSLLLQIDDLPSHVVVVTATNHPELLDRAVWRRFQVRVELPAPTKRQIETYLPAAGVRMNLEFGVSTASMAERLTGLSFAEVEEFTADVARRYVLTLPDANLKRIVGERLCQWQKRSKAK